MKPESSLIVRSAVASTRLFAKITAGLWGLHSGFWLGLLKDGELEQATKTFYASDDQFLDRGHNLSGLFPWEQAIADRYLTAGCQVLVPAAGAGREILALDTAGYRVVGYDPSPDLVDFGNHLIADTGSEAVLQQSNDSTLPLDVPGPFDAVLFGWGGISHVRGSEQRLATFNALFNILRPGGVLIVSFLHRSVESRRFALTYEVARSVRRVRRSRSPIELGDTIDGSFDHYFTFDEMARETRDAGFEEIDRIADSFAVIVCRRPL